MFFKLGVMAHAYNPCNPTWEVEIGDAKFQASLGNLDPISKKFFFKFFI